MLTVTNLHRNGQALGVHEGGGYWHTDMSYKSANTVFTSLLSVQVPDQHGETQFIDCVAGLHQVRQWLVSPGCPQHLKGLDLENLRIHHRFGNRDALRNADAAVQQLNSQEAGALEDTVVHPLVLKHPLSLYDIALCAGRHGHANRRGNACTVPSHSRQSGRFSRSAGAALSACLPPREALQK
ncbi:TauD/TfdA family dioxygenase [Pseudomonas syringae]|uniref:TauD/TfdA family dioxygenase n=1 Tax=Pseudomonas syringae TaxID=317 RepID=UPI001E2A351C|nr:TauD/TfdA family dioxygenase [Pseudomonas syringae]